MAMYGNNMLGAAQAFSPASMYGSTAQMNQGLGAQLFQPESQYNAGLITANRKEAMDAQIANAQSKNAFTSGLMGMVGSLGSGLLSNPSLFGAKTAGTGMNLGQGMDLSMPNTSISSTSLGGGFGTYQGLGGQTLGGGYQGITSNFNPSIPQFQNF
jgi:hypothetical protein